MMRLGSIDEEVWYEGDETYPVASVDDFVDQALMAELDTTWYHLVVG